MEDGVSTYWNPNGQKSSEAHYKEGTLMGPHIIWHENGQMKNKEHYKDGKREGLRTSWHENGQKSTEMHFTKRGQKTVLLSGGIKTERKKVRKITKMEN